MARKYVAPKQVQKVDKGDPHSEGYNGFRMESSVPNMFVGGVAGLVCGIFSNIPGVSASTIQDVERLALVGAIDTAVHNPVFYVCTHAWNSDGLEGWYDNSVHKKSPWQYIESAVGYTIGAATTYGLVELVTHIAHYYAK